MKAKGSRTERELVHMFFDTGTWAALRVAGSGSTTLPAPDLLVGNGNRVLAIECKSGKGKRYLDKSQIEELKEFSRKFGAEAWIGTRFDNEKWMFLTIEQLGMSKKGTPYIDIDLAKKKGVLFEELIKEFKQEKL